MCAEAKRNRVSLVSPDLNTIEQLFGELWRRIHNRSMHYGTFDNFRLLSVKNGRGFPRTLCGVTCFSLDLVIMQL